MSDTCPACGDPYADHCRTYLRIIRQLQERANRKSEQNQLLVDQLASRDATIADLRAALQDIELQMRRPQSIVMAALAKETA